MSLALDLRPSTRGVRYATVDIAYHSAPDNPYSLLRAAKSALLELLEPIHRVLDDDDSQTPPKHSVVVAVELHAWEVMSMQERPAGQRNLGGWIAFAATHKGYSGC
jgi:hypothetical protein